MQPRRELEEMNAYLRLVHDYIGQAEFERERLLARVEFFGSETGDSPPDKEPTQGCTAYLDWFVFDRRLSAQSLTPIRRYVDEHPELPESVRNNLLGCEHSAYSTFQVVEDGGEYVVVLDVLGDAGDYYKVARGEERGFRKGELLTARLVRWDGTWCFCGEPEAWPRSARDVLGPPPVLSRERRRSDAVAAPVRQPGDEPPFNSRRAWIWDRRQRP